MSQLKEHMKQRYGLDLSDAELVEIIAQSHPDAHKNLYAVFGYDAGNQAAPESAGVDDIPADDENCIWQFYDNHFCKWYDADIPAGKTYSDFEKAYTKTRKLRIDNCPFCPGKGRVINLKNGDKKVICRKCLVLTKACESTEIAVKMWNLRKPAAPQVDATEADWRKALVEQVKQSDVKIDLPR